MSQILPHPPLISSENVSFQYKTATALGISDINVQLEREKFYLLSGPTGSGKSTFLRMLNGLIPHFYHGTFYGYMKINGIDTIETTPAVLSEKVGMIFQNPENQLFAMNVEREITFGLENLGYPREKIQDRLNHALQIVGIEHLRFRPPYQLSGGEQQKVAIASIIAMDPDVLVLDEPLSNLDPKSAAEIVAILVNLQKNTEKRSWLPSIGLNMY